MTFIWLNEFVVIFCTGPSHWGNKALSYFLLHLLTSKFMGQRQIRRLLLSSHFIDEQLGSRESRVICKEFYNYSIVYLNKKALLTSSGAFSNILLNHVYILFDTG